MPYRTYAGDPRWIEVRRAGRCARCGDHIPPPSRAFYYPKGKSLYCAKDSCGHDCERDFTAAAYDEDVMGG